MNWPLQSEAVSFYGNPDPDGDGIPSRAWEDANLTLVTPPFRMHLAWAPYSPIRAIRIHKKCAPSLSTILQAIFELHGRDQAQIEAAHVNQFGGAYNFRLTRGGSRLSMHAYGCAIDIDPLRNAFGRTWNEREGMISRKVINIFEAEGWVSGANWTKPDAMHFQAARVG